MHLRCVHNTIYILVHTPGKGAWPGVWSGQLWCSVPHVVCVFSAGNRRQVHGPHLHRHHQVWGVGLLRRVQPTGGGRAVGCLHADPDHSGCPEEPSSHLPATGEGGGEGGGRGE